MALFSLRRRASTTSPAGATNSEQSLEAFADALRVFGKHGFDIPDESAKALVEWTERYARGLLLAADGVSLVDAKLALRRRREAESKFVPTALKSLKDALLQSLSGISDTVRDNAASDARVTARLVELREAVETESLDQLKQRVNETVGVITAELTQRRRQEQARVVEMGERVDTLQADLQAAEKKSQTDGLTGLYNRGAFDTDVRRWCALVEMTKQPLTVVMLDIDHFKSVNDTYGHSAGDAVIRAVANALVRAFPRKSDYIARYGGEEFVVLLRDASQTDGIRMAERFLAEIRKTTIEHDGRAICVTCSAGVAEHRPGTDAASVVKRADAALYRAKTAGRDRVTADGA